VAREHLLPLVLEKIHPRLDCSRSAAKPVPQPGKGLEARESLAMASWRAMTIPKDIAFVTFDVYGTLIDWETGVFDAFKKEAEHDGFTVERDELIPLFFEVQKQIQAGSYELYAEVLRRTAVQIAKTLGWPLEPSRAGFLPDSVQRWPPFKESASVLQKIAKKHKVGLIANIDDKLLGLTRRHLPTDFDLVVTAQQVRSYKPDPVHFKEAARRIGGKKGWLHIGCSYTNDVAPLLKMNVPVIWVNRHDEKLEGRKAPSATVKNFRDAAKKLGAS
jgi:2-haloacid dehalogenase/putative hydrolase of the HAD superfamily